MTDATSPIHYFGIRHHGPGCARSLLAALQALQPDCLLVEGPPEADELLHFMVDASMRPPVALLAYNSDVPALAAFYPFAEFSPEWQALRYAQAQKIPARFIDLPQIYQLLLEEKSETSVTELETAPGNESETSTAEPEVTDTETEEIAAPDDASALAMQRDPMGWLAEAAGFGDGESWWNHLVEERVDAADLFQAIADAMTVLREEFPQERTPAATLREARREAHMRRCIREAEKEGYQRIAVVCGAWHVPALAGKTSAKSDNELLKGLPKAKVSATWVPWTYRHLTIASGYGAGIRSPGWYEHLWRQPAERRTAAWLARVGKLLRAKDLDCSSAQIIDATRTAHTLAALRERANIGLEEINEAILATICMGDATPLSLIERELSVGDRLGRVPAGVPAVALQKDLEQQQKSLRLRPEALEKMLDLDLREANGIARSHLLHRLNMLGIGWGALAKSTGSKGSFHELWRLQWQPEFAIVIVEASRWGSTVEQAAVAKALNGAASAQRLVELTSLLDAVLLADLAPALDGVMRALADTAALTGDITQLLEAIPPLARVQRYGDVRGTRPECLQPVLDGLIARVCVGLGPACHSLDDDAAAAMRQLVLAVDKAIHLFEEAEWSKNWEQALARLAPIGNSHGLVCGMAARLLFDAGADHNENAIIWLSQALSVGSTPTDAAAWLEGFLHQGGLLLVHDERLWAAVDSWLLTLSEEHFVHVLPLVRRTFSSFSAHERQQLNARARHGHVARVKTVASDWNEERAQRPLPLLRRILGMEN